MKNILDDFSGCDSGKKGLFSKSKILLAVITVMTLGVCYLWTINKDKYEL